MKISNDRDDVLVTYSLGSCIGLSVYDPVARVGGIIHCMLPLSRIDPERAKAAPYMFADVGIPKLVQAALDLGARKDRIIAKAAGAAHLLNKGDMFRIGERNIVVMRKVLWKNNILIAAEETGGSVARTLTLYMNSGETTIKSKGREYELV